MSAASAELAYLALIVVALAPMALGVAILAGRRYLAYCRYFVYEIGLERDDGRVDPDEVLEEQLDEESDQESGGVEQ